jgi:hypothetical protein
MYKEIVEWYPGTEWAKNAAAARDLIGKTDEEIVREFEKRNKGK